MQVTQEKIPISEAIQAAITQMEKRKYSDSMMKRHKYIYRALQRFSESNCDGVYTSEIGMDFVSTLSRRNPPLSPKNFNVYINAVLRIDHSIDGDADWYPTPKQPKGYAYSCFDELIAEYETYLMNSGKTLPNVRCRVHIVSRFLRFVDSYGIKSLRGLTAPCIYAAFQAATDKGNFRKAVTAFLRYAYRYSLIPHDFSLIVPTVKRHTPILTVYSAEEVESLLTSIGRDSPVEKRNYAIVLIAARLGLRGCDICDLTFENINYTKGSIELNQSKTGEPLSLPLLPEIREALFDYIENARPDYDCKQIFLKMPQPHTGPLKPRALSAITRRLFDKTPFDKKGRRQGLQSLRSSLATALLNEGNDCPTVRKVLGHKSPNAVKSYIKVDVEHLRPCALTVPAPSAAFEKLLRGH